MQGVQHFTQELYHLNQLLALSFRRKHVGEAVEDLTELLDNLGLAQSLDNFIGEFHFRICLFFLIFYLFLIKFVHLLIAVFVVRKLLCLDSLENEP